MIDFLDPRNYKPCQKKQYCIHVCMPEKGTVVVNKLEQPSVLAKLPHGVCSFAQNFEESWGSQYRQAAEAGLAYLVDDKTPFVLGGTQGELTCITPGKLQQTYSFLCKGNVHEPINNDSLHARLVDGILPWTMIRTNPATAVSSLMACFIPVSQAGFIHTATGTKLEFNACGVSHGLGDFIVCSTLPDGSPNLSDMWVVNGEVFADTFNNRGWSQYLAQRVPGQRLPDKKLPTVIQPDKDLSRYQFAARKLRNVPGVACVPLQGCRWIKYEKSIMGQVSTLASPVLFIFNSQRGLAIDRRGSGFFVDKDIVMDSATGVHVTRKNLCAIKQSDILRFQDWCLRGGR